MSKKLPKRLSLVKRSLSIPGLLLLTMLPLSGCGTATPGVTSDQAALIDSIGALHQDVPDDLRNLCEFPDLHPVGDSKVVPSQVLATSIHQERSRLCEAGRKDEAVGIIDRTNAAILELQKALRKALKDSQIKANTWAIW